MSDLCGRNVVITGVAGTIGQALLQRVLAERPRAVHGLDVDLAEMGRLTMCYRGNRSVTLSVADIRDPLRLRAVMRGAEIVFHAAAMKDVGDCERDPAADARLRAVLLGTSYANGLYDVAQLTIQEQSLSNLRAQRAKIERIAAS